MKIVVVINLVEVMEVVARELTIIKLFGHHLSA